jgi:hypothetical protein
VRREAETHLEKATAYIAVAESGDAKRAAYEQAADEILAAMADDAELTQKAVGERIGKAQAWVSKLLKWHDEGHIGLPFSNTEAAIRYQQRTIPTRHEDKIEMAEKLLADPKVAKAAVQKVMAKPSHSRRVIDHAVHDANAERRRAERERAEQRRADGALPLPAYMATMVLKMDEWSGSLAALVDDIDELPEGRGREMVSEAAARLARQAQRWVDRLERRPQLEVIEGQARRPA